MGMNITAAKGKSPYATKQKAPFQYSDEYHNWVGACDRYGHDSEEAQAADMKFRRRFAVNAG
jgi:hypothetical protein